MKFKALRSLIKRSKKESRGAPRDHVVFEGVQSTPDPFLTFDKEEFGNMSEGAKQKVWIETVYRVIGKAKEAEVDKEEVQVEGRKVDVPVVEEVEKEEEDEESSEEEATVAEQMDPSFQVADLLGQEAYDDNDVNSKLSKQQLFVNFLFRIARTHAGKGERDVSTDGSPVVELGKPIFSSPKYRKKKVNPKKESFPHDLLEQFEQVTTCTFKHFEKCADCFRCEVPRLETCGEISQLSSDRRLTNPSQLETDQVPSATETSPTLDIDKVPPSDMDHDTAANSLVSSDTKPATLVAADTKPDIPVLSDTKPAVPVLLHTNFAAPVQSETNLATPVPGMNMMPTTPAPSHSNPSTPVLPDTAPSVTESVPQAPSTTDQNPPLDTDTVPLNASELHSGIRGVMGPEEKTRLERISGLANLEEDRGIVGPEERAKLRRIGGLVIADEDDSIVERGARTPKNARASPSAFMKQIARCWEENGELEKKDVEKEKVEEEEEKGEEKLGIMDMLRRQSSLTAGSFNVFYLDRESDIVFPYGRGEVKEEEFLNPRIRRQVIDDIDDATTYAEVFTTAGNTTLVGDDSFNGRPLQIIRITGITPGADVMKNHPDRQEDTLELELMDSSTIATQASTAPSVNF